MASTIEPASDGGGGDYIFRYTMTQGSDATRGFLGGLAPYVVGIKIDDVEVPVGTTQYFFAAGDHTVELTLSEGTIPDNCFVLWSEIKGIELVGEFKYIGERAFIACSGLTRISMDCRTLETVGPSAFAQIWNVVSFNNEADAVLDFASISSLGSGSLTGIAIGNATVKFGDMLTSFGNSSGYQGAAISERRPNGGFDIEFGTGLATIYGGAIDRCWIRNIVCKATTPPTFVPTSQTSIIFQGQLLGNIKVPAASVAAYKTAPGWSEYASMICPLWEGDISLNHLSLGDFRRRIMMGISEENKVVPARDGKVWAYYDVNDTSAATKLFGNTTGIPSTIEIDGVSVSRVTNYTFLTTGTHLVKFTPTTTYVGRGTFHTIPRLKELYLPSTITRTDGANENTASIRNCAILDTLGLSDTFTETRTCDITSLPLLTTMDVSKLTIVGNYSFQQLPLWMPELNMPELTTLRDRPFINAGITKIKSLGTITSLPGGANSINAPFLGCQQLTEVTLPATVTNITGFSFYNCPKLKTLTMLASTPPTLGNSAFRGTTALTTIYVPAGSISAYEAANNWSYWTGKYQEIS